MEKIEAASGGEYRTGSMAENGPAPNPLRQPVTALKGVGPERSALLARLQIQTIEDLLLHSPRRYEDRRHFKRIGELSPGEAAVIRGSVVAKGVQWRGRRSLCQVLVDDGSGRLHCRWWNQPFMERNFQQGDVVMVFGELKQAHPRAMDHPETETLEGTEEAPVHLDRIVPIYPLTEGLSQRTLRGFLWRALQLFGDAIEEPWNGIRVTGLPSKNGEGLLPGRRDAVRWLHFPEELQQAELARQRLALDEYIELQIRLKQRRTLFQTRARALPCAGTNRLIRPFLKQLSFKLTPAQKKVLKTIREDLGGVKPMRRLLQGDVGSGKTVVAACAALRAIESGFTVVLMAPTGILAEQLFSRLQNWLGPLSVEVRLLTGERKDPLSGTSPKLVVGTHALLGSEFGSGPLGLVIIDEQHKFGVAQRETLLRKGEYPHLLVMTATPIPRTLALTLYGDLEVSAIDELPAGRGRIRTFVRNSRKLPAIWHYIKNQLATGKQAYVVYARVDETEGNQLKAATREFAKISSAIAPHPAILLHGRMAASEKEEAMEAFRTGRAKVLVSTSLIEVGVDVPQATIMVVENAERFGLPQLHQLRGRIGRAGYDSECILVSDLAKSGGQSRLEILTQTTDGFKIAEADLALRGPGELLGHNQSGVPPLRFGDLRTDLEWIKLARKLTTSSGPVG